MSRFSTDDKNHLGITYRCAGVIWKYTVISNLPITIKFVNPNLGTNLMVIGNLDKNGKSCNPGILQHSVTFY